MSMVTWRMVLGVLQHDETRSYALKLYRDAGFSPDSFRVSPQARTACREALTRTEDYWELAHPRMPRVGAVIREVRRALEAEEQKREDSERQG